VTRTILPPLAGETGAVPADVNGAGTVVGVSQRFPAAGNRRGVIWRDGGVAELVPAPAGESADTGSVRINDRHQVLIGIHHIRPGGPTGRSTYLWEDGRLADLGGGALDSRPLALNERGEVLLWRRTAATDQWGEVVRWSAGVVSAIPPPPGLSIGPTPRVFLNDAGEVAGTFTGAPSADGTVTDVPFRWRDGAPTLLPGPGTVYGMNNGGDVVGVRFQGRLGGPVVWRSSGTVTLPGPPALVNAINDRGDVTGTISGDGGAGRAVRWRDGRAAVLDVPGSVASRSVALDADGRVLVEATMAEGRSHALLWDGLRTVDLGPVQSTADLNDRGQVVGLGIDAVGGRAGVLWTVPGL
jgi:uncharacterized membrane protein